MGNQNRKGAHVADNQDPLLSGEGALPADPLGDGARARIKGKRKGSARVVDARPSSPAVVPSDPEALAKYQEAMQRLFSPKSWERVICAPFDAALLATGAPEFDLPKDTREDLGADMALVLQFWGGGVDPKYLVLVKATADIASVGANCWLAYKTRKLEEALEAAKKSNG